MFHFVFLAIAISFLFWFFSFMFDRWIFSILAASLLAAVAAFFITRGTKLE